VSKVYHADVLEICDNGDAVLEIPPELMKDMGWEVGDVLNVDVEGEKIILKNITKENNNEVTQGN
jgi:antitoxin component of MazEF toxin-antitoxin module